MNPSAIQRAPWEGSGKEAARPPLLVEVDGHAFVLQRNWLEGKLPSSHNNAALAALHR